MKQEIFFFKNHTPKVVEKLVPDPFIRNQNWSYLVCIGVSTPSLKNTTPIRELPNHPFLGDPTLHIGFSWIPHPLKNHIFQWNPKILTLSYLLKETKFIVKIFQFAFLVWQRKYFCLDTSLSLNISKIEILLKKFTPPPLFPSNPTIKFEVLSSPPFWKWNLPYDFWRRILLTLYFINRPNFIAWLPLLLEILCSMCIAITWSVTLKILKFNIAFLSSRFFYLTKKSGEKCKYL